MIVLAAGDAHIPDHAISIPPQIKTLLTPGKINQVLALGNVSDPDTQQLLRGIAKDFRAVRGSGDQDHTLPLADVVTVGELRIGLVSGFTVIPSDDPDVLLLTARELDVDVLLWGGSHVADAFILEDKLFVNPGSLTGAFTAHWTVSEPVPSFCLLDFQDQMVTTYLYSCVDSRIKVEKVIYKKGDNPDLSDS